MQIKFLGNIETLELGDFLYIEFKINDLKITIRYE